MEGTRPQWRPIVENKGVERGRGMVMSVRVSVIDLAVVLLHMKDRGLTFTSLSGGVGHCVHLMAEIAVEKGIVEPVSSVEEAFSIFKALGMRVQERSRNSLAFDRADEAMHLDFGESLDVDSRSRRAMDDLQSGGEDPERLQRELDSAQRLFKERVAQLEADETAEEQLARVRKMQAEGDLLRKKKQESLHNADQKVDQKVNRKVD